MRKENADLVREKLIPNSTIAAHSVSGNDAVNDSVSIFWNGLGLKLGEGPLFNCVIEKSVDEVDPNIYSLHDENGNKVTLVIAIPEVMKDANGQEWFMGKFPVGAHKYDDRADSLPINRYLARRGVIPPEFIVGALISNDGKETSLGNSTVVVGHQAEKFSFNSRYIGNKSEEERAQFFESMKEELVESGLKRVNDRAEDPVSVLLGENQYYNDSLKMYQERVKSTGKVM